MNAMQKLMFLIAIGILMVSCNSKLENKTEVVLADASIPSEVNLA